MSKDLIAFLNARLDEDEQVARNASGGPWVRRIGYISGGLTGTTRVAQQAQAWNADHIVRHDPARVLRDIESKRRLLEQFRLRGDSVRAVVKPATGGVWDDLLRMLALPYSNHADYREEWRP